jgi:copper chaperone CopZ
VGDAVYGKPPVVLLVVGLALLFVACGGGARRGARTGAASSVLASPVPAVTGGAADGTGGNHLVVEPAGDRLTFSSTAYCKACSASIAEAVATLRGVQRADVDPTAAAFRILVQYDPARVSAERITEEVQSALLSYDLNKLVLHRVPGGVELSSGRFT